MNVTSPPLTRQQAVAQLASERRAFHADPAFVPAIRFEGVEKTLDHHLVLKGVDLAIPAQRITAIIGMSGSGKSVTLKHMIGLMQPERGAVWVGERQLNRLSPRALNDERRRFGMLFQGGALFDSMNVFDNVAFPLRERRRVQGAKSGLTEEAIRARVERNLTQVNLGGMGHKYPDELSGGMTKRAALARAMVTDPDILLLDEPTAGLDPIIENSIHHLIAETYAQRRYTMVVISHAVPEIFNWCHHVVVFHQGRVLEAGSSLAILDSKNPVIRQFVRGELEGPIQVI